MIFSFLFFTGVLSVFTAADNTSDRLCERSKLIYANICYEQSNPQNCWEERPTNLPNCTLEHALNKPDESCFFTNLQCIKDYFESNDYKDPDFTIARCRQVNLYYRDEDGSPYDSVVCEGFSIDNRWNDLEKIGTAETTCTNHWWKAACCFTKPEFSFRYGVCSEESKYLGDECGDEWGICKNDENDGIEYQLSCYQRNGTPKPRCYPSTNDMVQKSCSCNSLPTKTCASKDCNGHQCVRDGNFQYWCDWSSGNNW